jgi:hypothetical protein
MFQRLPIHKGYDDPQLSNFYGHVLPFLKRGIPVSIAHIENLGYKNTLADTKILLMTYSNMKPLDGKAHEYLAEWVKKGGILVYNGSDNDPFQNISEWWNQDPNNYPTASAHLFEKLGLGLIPEEGEYKAGKGMVRIIRHDPKDFVLQPDSDRKLFGAVSELYKKSSNGKELETKNSFHLRRGPYELISVMDESISNDPFVINGLFIDLFDPDLPILTQKTVHPGNHSMLYNLDHTPDKKKVSILATGARVSDEAHSSNEYSFIAKSPVETSNVMRIFIPRKPKDCTISYINNNISHDVEWEWDDPSSTVLMKFENHPDGVAVKITY